MPYKHKLIKSDSKLTNPADRLEISKLRFQCLALITLMTSLFFSSISYGLDTPPTVYGINPPNTTNNKTINNFDAISVSDITGASVAGISSVANNTIISNSSTGSITVTSSPPSTYDSEAIGIYSNGNSNTLSNSGAINTTATFISGSTIISSYACSFCSTGDSNSLGNSGTINVTATGTGGGATDTSSLAYGIYSNGNSNILSNSGTINTTETVDTRSYAYNSVASGIYSSGDRNNLGNSGMINATGGDNEGNVYGMYSKGNSNILSNSGTINARNGFKGEVYGLMAIGNSNIISNSGIINAVSIYQGSSYGFNSLGDNNTITNSGTINSTGEEYSLSMDSIGDNNTITNSGIINAKTSIISVGINSHGNSNTIINSGTINASRENNDSTVGGAIGIGSNGNNNTISNLGSINATAGFGDAAIGIFTNTENNTINNSGTIIARGGDISRAIDVEGNNNTVNINKGSLLVGDLYTNGTGNTLNINLGAGASYAYQATGAWSVHDLDNRPVVTGSAYAAGIGAQETAGQILYQRTSSITNSLDRRLRDYTTYNQSKIDAPYWIDTYYSDSTRGAGTGNSLQTSFSNQNYGFTAGYKLPITVTPVEAIVNFEQSALNISNASQSVTTSSVMTGLLAPKIAERFGINLSSKALIGWGGHSGDRKVYTNSLLYNGTQNVTSEYDSVYGVVGSALTRSFTFTDYLKADVLAGFDVDIQGVSSYSESAYFHWNDRTLTQLQSRLQAGLTTNLLNNTLSFFGRVGVEQRDLVSGQAQNYQIQGTNVTFSGGRMDNTYVTGQLGTTYDVYKKVQLFGVVSSTNGLGSVQTIQGNFGVRTNF